MCNTSAYLMHYSKCVMRLYNYSLCGSFKGFRGFANPWRFLNLWAIMINVLFWHTTKSTANVNRVDNHRPNDSSDEIKWQVLSVEMNELRGAQKSIESTIIRVFLHVHHHRTFSTQLMTSTFINNDVKKFSEGLNLKFEVWMIGASLVTVYTVSR